MLRVNRSDLIQKLESIQPGLSPRGILDQSDCFVFQDGKIHTFNGEVSCIAQGLSGITGAVKASVMLTHLGKWVEEELELEIDDGQLWIFGVKKKTHLNVEEEIHLPVSSIETPTDWLELPPQFGQAVDIVSACAGRDEKKFQLTCVHVHPEYVEASDDVQISRYAVKTGIEDCLVRASAIKNLAQMGASHFSVTKAWIHFKNPSGLIFSCLRYMETWPDMSEVLKIEGTVISFPKTLGDTLKRAEDFSKENTSGNQVLVSLLPGKMRIKSEGSSGGYSEQKEINYAGASMSFFIAPKMLDQIVTKHNEVYVNPDKLVVDAGQLTYRTCTEPEQS